MADWDGGGYYDSGDDMTPMQRMARVISPDADNTPEGGATPGHPPQPPTPDTTPATTAATIPATAPASMIPPSFAMPSRGEQALADVGPAPQYDTQKLGQLQGQRTALSTPIDPNQQQYKLSTGQKIMRGLGSFLLAGPGGPLLVNYNKPNRQYGIDEAKRQAQLGNVNQQVTDLDKTSDEQQRNYTGRLNQAKEQIQLEKNEDLESERERHNQSEEGLRQQTNDTRQQLADTRQQLADQNVPKTFEALRAAQFAEKDPAKRAQYKQAADEIQKDEVKRFSFAARNNGEQNSSKRQSLIDQSKQKIQDLQDRYEYDPEQNAYIDKLKPGSPALSPQQYTDLKNTESTRLDAALTKAKLKPLGVYFNPEDAQGSQYRKGGQPSGQPAAAPSAQPTAGKPTTPTSKQAFKIGDTVTRSSDGQKGKIVGINPNNGKPQVDFSGN